MKTILAFLLLTTAAYGQASTLPLNQRITAPEMRDGKPVGVLSREWRASSYAPDRGCHCKNRGDCLCNGQCYCGETHTQNHNEASWNFSPAAEHHKAAVRITCGGNATAGVFIQYNGFRGVLTCGHGVADYERGTYNAYAQKATVTFSDGSTASGYFTTDKYRFDIAWIFVDSNTIEPLSFSDQAPQVGQRVEYMGFGGPRKDRMDRHFYGTVTASNSRSLETDAAVIPGDSGAAMLNESGEVVGVQSVGRGLPVDRYTQGGNSWEVFPDAGGASYTSIRGFLGRVFNSYQQCGPWGCPPGQQPGYPGGGNPQIYPDQVQPPPVVNQTDPRIDQLVIQIQALTEKIETIQVQSGPAGKDGEQGPPGPPGPAATFDDTRLSELEIRILALEQAMQDSATPSGHYVTYITTTGLENTREADAAADALRASGYPIVKVTLKRENVTAHDVPQLFLYPERRGIIGVDNVLAFLREQQDAQ